MAELQAKSAFKDKGSCAYFSAHLLPSRCGSTPMKFFRRCCWKPMVSGKCGSSPKLRSKLVSPDSGGPIRQGTGISRQLTYELSDPLEIPAGEHRTSLVAAQAQVKSYMVANTRFTPNFTHRVAFGVLDLPGFDGLLGVGFLNQFLPYSIEVASPTDKVVRFTLPKTKEVIQLRGVRRQRYILGSIQAESIQRHTLSV